MALSSKQRQHLKALAHNLHPVVILGSNGLTDNVVAEMENALAFHELIKVKINIGDKEDRDQLCGELALRTSSEFVYLIGRVGIFYRASDKHKISLP